MAGSASRPRQSSSKRGLSVSGVLLLLALATGTRRLHVVGGGGGWGASGVPLLPWAMKLAVARRYRRLWGGWRRWQQG